MCHKLDQNTCYECAIKFKGAVVGFPDISKEYEGVSITCKCGSTEYFISPYMPFHKIILPFDRKWIKGIRKLLSAGEEYEVRKENFKYYMRKRNKSKRVDK